MICKLDFPSFHVFITYSRYLHVLVSIFLCVSKFEALLLENVRIPQSEIELKQIEAGWAAGDRITACSTPRWLVAGM